MYPELHIGPLTLQTFGLMFALAFLAAGALIAKRLKEIGRPVDWAYEMGLAALILWQLRDRFRAGVLFAIYLIYAGVERFAVEFLRRNSEVALGLTSAQFESLGMMVIGTIWILGVRRRHGSLSAVASNEPIRPVAGL